MKRLTVDILVKEFYQGFYKFLVEAKGEPPKSVPVSEEIFGKGSRGFKTMRLAMEAGISSVCEMIDEEDRFSFSWVCRRLRQDHQIQRKSWPVTSWLEMREFSAGDKGVVKIMAITKDAGETFSPFIPGDSHLRARDWQKKDNGGKWGRKD